jgi:hypothetical protein
MKDRDQYLIWESYLREDNRSWWEQIPHPDMAGATITFSSEKEARENGYKPPDDPEKDKTEFETVFMRKLQRWHNKLL